NASISTSLRCDPSDSFTTITFDQGGGGGGGGNVSGEDGACGSGAVQGFEGVGVRPLPATATTTARTVATRALAAPFAVAASAATAFFAGTQGANQDLPPRILYHYTSGPGLEGILGTQSINPSLDGVYGAGVYFSNITPGSMSSAELAERFIGVRDDFRFDHFVGVDVTNLTVVPDRENVFHVPATTPLPVAGRILAAGENSCSSE
ncbi:MAG: HYD1 signature containing ADP-ribosyltransferase family protein, partial [Pseudomonadota bacterium]